LLPIGRDGRASKPSWDFIRRLLAGLSPLGALDSRALPGESYKLAFTPGLLTQVYRRPLDGVLPPGAPPPENLLPTPSAVLPVDAAAGSYADRGGFLSSEALRSENLFPANAAHPLRTRSDADDHWWIPSGRVFHSPGSGDTPAQELAYARQHFFLPRRYRDPFHTLAVSTETLVTYDAYDLLLLETRDALGNVVTVATQDDTGSTAIRMDYRILQPFWVTDPNGNRTRVAFDALGLVVATALMGKPGENLGDTLDGFESDLTPAQIDRFYEAADPHVPAALLLEGATTRIVYDLGRFLGTQQAHPEDASRWLPVYAATMARETHTSDPLPAGGLKIQISFSYSDGFGREIQKKIQAEPGPLVEGGPTVSPRWVGNGWTLFNNKGKPVRQYEPFFSRLPDKRHQFEFGVQVGVSPILFYDPVERVVATLHPNHTWQKVVFDPWRQATWDVNDTVTLDPRSDAEVKGFFLNPDGTPRLPVAAYLPTWHALRTDPAHAAVASQRWPDPKKRNAEEEAAEKAAVHAGTPTIAHFDALGRTFLTVAHNRFQRERPDHTWETVEEKYPTRVHMDIEGNQREVRDAIEQDGDKLGRIVMRYRYDMLGNRIHQASMEAGERWMLNDAAGKPIRAWDSRDHAFRTEYDPLRRILRAFVTGADPSQPDQELLTERLIYGEQHPQSETRNLRGKLYLHLDQAGAAANEAHDFKGNLLRATQRLAREYKQAVTWSAVDAALPFGATTKLDATALEAALTPRLEGDTYSRRTTYDAPNRPAQLIAPHSDQPGARLHVIQPVYNEANLLERVHVWLDRPDEPTGLLDAATVLPSPVGVNNIEYNAKGQRLRIEYKNGATTRYVYDPETFRLIHLYTRRGATFTEDCENPQPPPPTMAAPDIPLLDAPCGLQNLHYSYDPAGNITHIRDDAQQRIHFAGQVVPPQCGYTYDAIYRLIQAAGREHIGQVGQPETTWNDAFRVRLPPHPNDGQAMRNYTERYQYDAVGNVATLIHQAANGSWARSYAYNEASLLEPDKKSNRLSSTTVGNGTPETHPYDAHGNITRMDHLPLMQWDYRDQLQATAQQVINAGTPETTWYVYDADGQRMRKVTELATGQVKDERIYLGGFEIYRRHGTNPLTRETLHIMDDKQHIALVEMRSDTPAAEQLIRYQFGNHLGSTSLELDHQAHIISYEEFYPYGSTSYQAVRSQVETPKRYRYTAKERDGETGLNYHGARYYAPWLARWTKPDPQDLRDATNVYIYALNNPVIAKDPTGGPAWLIPVAIYLGWRALEAAAETGIEAGIASATGDESFSAGGTFVKNLAVNSVIGLIPGAAEAKIGAKATIYTGKLALRTTGDATLDTLQGKGTFEENLQKNAIANVAGDAAGSLLKKGGEKIVEKLKGTYDKAVNEVTDKATKEATDRTAKEATDKVADEATDEIDKALDRTFSGGNDEGLFQTAERLVRGNLGERLAADSLASQGHTILSFKPSILGTNQGGIDIVTIRNGVVHLIDNKALTRSGNVSSVSALTTNFAKNLAAVRQDLATALVRPGISQAEQQLLQQAVSAIDKGSVVRAVTNANLAPNNAILTGVSKKLQDMGIRFIDVF
jgi:RHS repeat-associated protein